MAHGEVDDLVGLLEWWKEGMDVPYHHILPKVPDQDQLAVFVAILEREPPKTQASFLALLAPYRPQCEPYLAVLFASEDETVAIWAADGLLYTPRRTEAIAFLAAKIRERLDEPALELGEWPIHFLSGMLEEEDSDESMATVDALRIELRARAAPDHPVRRSLSWLFDDAQYSEYLRTRPVTPPRPRHRVS